MMTHSITVIIRMHSDGSVSEHGLWARCRHYDPFVYADGVISVREHLHIEDFQTRALNGVCKRRDDTKLELLFGVITWHAQ